MIGKVLSLHLVEVSSSLPDAPCISCYRAECNDAGKTAGCYHLSGTSSHIIHEREAGESMTLGKAWQELILDARIIELKVKSSRGKGDEMASHRYKVSPFTVITDAVFCV